MNLVLKIALFLLLFSCGNTPKNTENTTTLQKTTAVKDDKSVTMATNKNDSEPEEVTLSEAEIASTVKVSEKTKQKLALENNNVNTTTDIKSDVEVIKVEKKEENIKTKMEEPLSYKAWAALLKKYVDDKGNVNYAGFKKDSATLQSFLDILAKNKPESNVSKNEKLAYYINLYNAATVKLILDNYPTKSIKDIKNPWGKKWVKVGNETLSLGNIEHKILRKMNEPRIHFAINCASYSCPKLVNTPFTASGMEKQLEQATKDFINDTTRNKFDGKKIELSEIFKWYKGDFTENSKLLAYIENYANVPVNSDKKITHLNYDWSLNEAK